jgi:DNA-directed RNA polymerase specialized sigma subunit
MHATHTHAAALEPDVVWSLYSYIVTDAVVDLVSQRELASHPEHVQHLVRTSAVALFEAADTFDPSGSIDFHDYASMLVHRILYAELRRGARRRTLNVSAQRRG